MFRSLPSLLAFFSEAWFLGRPTWLPERDMPDLTGRVFIVTGGSSGLGRDTVRALLKRKATVYIAARDEKRARATISALREETGATALYLELDLADLDSVKAAAECFKSKETRLDALYNNAALLTVSIDDVRNGYDGAMFTNVIGPFYLTQLLIPPLQYASSHSAQSESVLSPGMPDSSRRPSRPVLSPSRVLNLSSSVHHVAGVPILDFNSFKDGPGRRKYTDLNHFYAQTKAAVILFSNELARRYGPEKGIVSIAVNPGNFLTPLTRNVHDRVRNFLTKWLLYIYPSEWGCITQLWAGTASEAASCNGKYLIPWGREGCPRPETSDLALAGELWLWLEEQVREWEAGGWDGTKGTVSDNAT